MPEPEDPADADPGGSGPGVPWRILCVAAVLVTSVVLAGAAWSGRSVDEPAPAADGSETHQLTVNQAVCLRFGLIARRSQAHELTLALGKYVSLDPTAAIRLQDEVTALDAIASDFPAADYRIVRSIANASDSGAAVLAASDSETYRDAVSGRSAFFEETRVACSELADFDTTALTRAQA